MPIIPLKCPACGAQLQVNSDDAILTCKFCGVSSVMKDAIVHNYIQNTVNITADTVNVVNRKDFVIEGGVLKKYQGESMDVVIPDNVVAIGANAFQGLRIKSVKIPNSVEEIGNWAFYLCTSLTSVIIPNSVKEIGDWAFSGCTSLTSVTIPDGVKEISNSAFNGTPYGMKLEEEEKRRREENERAERRRQGRCQHCGGDFKGLAKKCVRCGKPKDY